MASLYRHSGITMSSHRHHYLVTQTSLSSHTSQCRATDTTMYDVVTLALLYRHTDTIISSQNITISSHRHHYLVTQTSLHRSSHIHYISSHRHYWSSHKHDYNATQTSLSRHTDITISSHRHHYIVTHTSLYRHTDITISSHRHIISSHRHYWSSHRHHYIVTQTSLYIVTQT